MRQIRPVFLDKIEIDYLRSQIDTGENIKIKNALQTLCKRYRMGHKIRPEQLVGVLNAVVGTAFSENTDEKVRRWILNAVARIGDESRCMEAVRHLLRKHGNEPQTIASGIAAVYKLSTRNKPADILRGLSFDPAMVTLAALQHVPHYELDFSGLPLNVDKASSDLLKLALLVVGLGKSPENLLNPRHSDAEMVRALGRHHDPVVSQYSVWAITENDGLGVCNLGISIEDVYDYPENVRSWVFQLLAIEANDKEPYWEIIRQAMSDPSAEARRGLAQGFKHTFVDVFEPLILDWILSEPDTEVRQLLIEHLVRQAPKSVSYESYALELYEGESPESPLRRRMEASAIKTPLYARFRQIDAGSMGDLFGRGGITVVVEKQINIGSVQGGAVNIGDGQATNFGTTNIQVFSAQKIQEIQSELAKLEAEIYQLKLDGETERKALTSIADAKSDPSPSKIGKVVEVIGHIGTVAEAAGALAPYAASLGSLIGWG